MSLRRPFPPSPVAAGWAASSSVVSSGGWHCHCSRSLSSEPSPARKQPRAASPRKASSQYKGVHWRSPPGKWQVVIYDPRTKRRRNLGFFDDEVQAAKAYDESLRAMQKAAPAEMAARGMRPGSIRARPNFPRRVTKAHRLTAHRDNDRATTIEDRAAADQKKNHVIADAINQSYRKGEVEQGDPDKGGHSR